MNNNRRKIVDIFKNRKFFGTFLGIVFYLFCIFFFTYAFYSWRSGNTDIVIGIVDSSVDVEFENNGNVNAENIGPVLSYLDGVSGGFTATNGTSENVNIKIKLKILSISSELLTKQFKYIVVRDTNGGEDYDYDNPIATGDFSSFSVGINFLASDDIVSSQTYKYKVIVYIDGTVENDLNLQGKSLNSILYISDYLYLNEFAEGSYVEYSGANGCPDGHCDGTNANYVDDTSMGYCVADSYKFTTNGWRIGYIKSGSVYLISSGSTECMCTNSDGTTSDTSCSTYDTSDGLSQHLGNLNSKALSYCNVEFAYGGLCDATTTWSFKPTDFQNITGSAIYYNSSDDISCLNGNGENCGSDNDLINNGGYYWISGTVTESSSTTTMHWFPYFNYATYNDSSFAYGVRPVIKLDEEVIITGGSGTYEDPYKIKNPNWTASKYIQNLYNDGSAITTVNIGGDSSKPEVHLNTTQGIMLDNNGDYRYYGADPNNYVSYNDELWRIISVSNVKSSEMDTVGESRVKIVKADILTDDDGLSSYSWDSSASTVNSGYGVNDWSQADLMTELNTLYFNSTSGACYTGSRNTTTACNFTNTGLSAEARNLTADALYYLGGSSEVEGLYPNDYYTFERGTEVYDCSTDDGACPRATTWTGRVGIIYPSDYTYATDLSVCTKDVYSYDADENCHENDWLLDTDNWQWTISPCSSDAYYAFFVYLSGIVDYFDYSDAFVSHAEGVQPVQYLKSEVTIVDGEGTSEKPYILGT